MVIELYMCWCGSKVWMYNREPISGPCGPNAALLPADDRAALCFSFQGRRDRKWASVRPDTGQKVIPDEWKSLRRTQTCRTDKDGTWNSFIFADPWDTGRLTNTQRIYIIPQLQRVLLFRLNPVCAAWDSLTWWMSRWLPANWGHESYVHKLPNPNLSANLAFPWAHCSCTCSRKEIEKEL